MLLPYVKFEYRTSIGTGYTYGKYILNKIHKKIFFYFFKYGSSSTVRYQVRYSNGKKTQYSNKSKITIAHVRTHSS